MVGVAASVSDGFTVRDGKRAVAGKIGRERRPVRYTNESTITLRISTVALLSLALAASTLQVSARAAARTATAGGSPRKENVGTLKPLQVSENKRFLVTSDGQPFFYLGDTAWELFHRLDRRQAVEYLQTRAAQKYTVIQAVALAELDGINTPNAHGRKPLLNNNPATPDISPGNEPGDAKQYDYWDHVDFIVSEAAKRQLYIGFLPTWASWVQNGIVNEGNAEAYGRFLGSRYARQPIIWVLGGDRNPEGKENVWRTLAKGIAVGVSGAEDYSKVLMTFHPPGGGASSRWFHDDAWLDFNMHQTGHGTAAATQGWNKIKADYERTPIKPVLDGEPLYEDHPIGFGAAKANGFSFDAHVRQRAYWHVFAGAPGHTYGNHAVWQMYGPGKQPVNGPLFHWSEAIHRPGAAQMQYLRALIESRPMLSRVPDQSLVTDALDGAERIQATRGDGYAFIYSGAGHKFTVNFGKISGAQVKAHWFNPRNGAATLIGTFDNQGTREFKPQFEGFGSDWVLVLDDASKNWAAPGSVS